MSLQLTATHHLAFAIDDATHFSQINSRKLIDNSVSNDLLIVGKNVILSLPFQQSTPAPLILDITLDNWSTFQQSFKLFTKFGVAGQQILSNCAIPLTPFANAPSKFDLDRTSDGVQIPDQFIYARRSTSAEETALPGFNLASISLTECSNRELCDDLKI